MDSIDKIILKMLSQNATASATEKTSPLLENTVALCYNALK